MGQFLRSLLLVVGFAAVTAACGSPFVEGWRDDNEDSRTPAEKCEAREGWSWINDSCAEDDKVDLPLVSPEQCGLIADTTWIDDQCRKFASLNEEQCGRAANPAWAWWASEGCIKATRVACLQRGPDFDLVGDLCLELPRLTTQGALTQTVAGGQAMQPIELVVSAGAGVSLVNASCPGYFAISNNTLGSTAGAVPPAGQTSCDVDVVATLNTLKSRPTHVKVSFTAGFLDLCRDQPTYEISRTIEALVTATDKPNCEEAAKVLADVQKLSLNKADLVDLSPLAGLPKLQILVLTGNPRLRNVAALAGVTKLANLNLSGTAVTDLSPLAKHPSLSFLNMDYTPLDLGVTAKTAANCPTGDKVIRAVSRFCAAPAREQ